MARKFILIDQSISSIAGHHYEYALHVLEAADRAGFEPHLATHRKFARRSHQSPWRTFPLYRYGFWAAHEAPRSSLVNWLLGTLGRLRFRWRLMYNYSLLGLLWSVKDQFGEFLLRQPLAKSNLWTMLGLIPLAIVLKGLRFLGALLLLPFVVVVYLLAGVWRLMRAGGLPVSYVNSLLADARDLARLMRTLLVRRNDYLSLWKQRRCVRGFKADTLHLLRQADARDGDVVFLPTVSAVELMGLAELVRADPKLPRLEWHLLYRRDLYRGRRTDYAAQDAELNGLRRVMLESAEALGGTDVRFYTDTEELSEQHNRLGVFRFETVAIPHTHTPPADKGRERRTRLRIIYVGDARREKGYHWIPRLVEDLWQQYVESGRVSFHLQSNFNVPQGEPEAVIARQQLEALSARQPGAIELITQPLTSEQYRQFLLSGDINLLMYDPVNYYARSSGILVESLSAGIPVLVPAGCWLSRQFREAMYREQWAIASSMDTAQRYQLKDLRWQLLGSARATPLADGGLRGDYQARAFTWVRLEEPACRLVMRLRLRGEAYVYVDQQDGRGNALRKLIPRLVEPGADGDAVVVERLHPAATRLWVGIGASVPGASVLVTSLDMRVLRAPEEGGCRRPLASIGGVYHDPSEIPTLMSDLIEHYDSYRDGALRFAAAWREYHNSDQLVRQLVSGSGRR